MRRVSLLVALALTVLLSADAQSPRSMGFLTSADCPGTGCISLDVSGLSSVAIQVSGTWTGTLSFESSVDGATFTALILNPTDSTTGVTTATANGVWSGLAGGLRIVRVRMSVFGSGIAIASIQGARGRPPNVGSQLEFTDTPLESFPAAADAVLVTPNAVSMTNSNWFEVIPSTATAIAVAHIVVNQGADIVAYCVSLGIGAVAAEVQVAETCGFSGAEANGTRQHILNLNPPQVIASGQRVSFRMRKTGVSVTQWGFAMLAYGVPVLGNPVTTTANSTVDVTGTAVTPNAGSWVNSNWFQWEASTATDWVVNNISVVFGACANRFFQVDLGVGGAGSEVVKWTGHGLVGAQTGCLQNGSQNNLAVQPPLLIPAGSRVAYRLRKSDTDVNTWQFWPTFYPTSSGFGKIYTRGTNPQTWTSTNTEGNVSVVGSGASWVFGAWSEAIASTSTAVALTALYSRATTTSGDRVFEIGTGTLGNEVAVGIAVRSLAGGLTGWYQSVPIVPAIPIAAGQRVSIRMSSEVIAATTDTVNLGFIANPDFAQVSNNTTGVWPLATGANGHGVSVTPNALAWNNSTWVELIASTGTGRKLLTNLICKIGGGTPREWEVDIGAGTAGNEVVLTTFRGMTANISAGIGALNDRFVVPQRMPANTRLAVRVRGQGVNTAAWRIAVRWVQQ